VSSVLVTGIGELVTNDPAVGDGSALGLLTDAALVTEQGFITWVGAANHAPSCDHRIDLYGCAVIPGFVDAHTHLIFAGDRAAEFATRMSGTRYDGGGIMTTVEATRAATDDQLRRQLSRRVTEACAQGTTTLEIKSGYGLTVAGEARLLRLAREFTSETTYLGGHVIPHGLDRGEYVDLVSGAMLAACAPHARWIDVFCEPASPHAFTEEEARVILAAGRDAGLQLRVHGNQLSPGPGVQLAVELGAASVDHCTHLTPADIDALTGSTTVATLLPCVEFATRSPYPNARRLLDAGVTVALATDCNPGSCYTSSMPLIIALAVREMGMTPAEALWAATAGAAQSLRRDDIGALSPGRRADLTVVDAPTYLHLAYRPAMPITRAIATRDRPVAIIDEGFVPRRRPAAPEPAPNP
jgi:imidazolonepropionase